MGRERSGAGWPGGGVWARWGVLAALAGLPVSAARADISVSDMWNNGTASGGMLFPNWRSVWLGSFDVWLCDGCTGFATENLVGLTVVNFGTAGTADLTNLSFRVSCSSQPGTSYPLTYAGTYTEDSGTYNAWTWTGGATVDLSGCSDLCGNPPCGGFFTINLYGDVTPCPGNLQTVALGFPTHEAADPAWWGSIYDNTGFVVPWYDVASELSTIVYTYKTSNQTTVAPGDTVTYTLFYGKPGTAALTSITIMDTQPPFTHYVAGSSSQTLDLGWDPNWGPPPVLKWTINPVVGNLPAWGPTSQLTFSLTVDWGNLEWFEPGSGDVAAPEGQRLANVAQVFWNGIAGCANASMTNPPVSTVVKRFQFWCLGDNDILYSPTYGQPADEMIYSISIKNLSATKTWWNVVLWDTVPPDLDVWGPSGGFEDPCVGWTLTPTGCAAATPGILTNGGKTILTWKLDMPPQFTLTVRWKAQVAATARSSGTVVNVLSVYELGSPATLGGTGASMQVRSFAHLAPIVLPTTYTSYVGYGIGYQCCPGYFLDFFPLNKKTEFELRGLFYAAVPFSLAGGVSLSIGNLLGDCLGGFPLGGVAGCRAERVPAKFDPGMAAIGDCTGSCPLLPYHAIFKVTSNSPTLWQLLTHVISHDEDNHTYAPSTTISYTGLMHYVWRRESPPGDPAAPGNGDCLEIVNTSLDPYGAYSATLDTSIYEFKFNSVTLAWDLFRSFDVAGESAVYDWTTNTGDEGAYRTVSSQSQLIIEQGMLTNPLLPVGGQADNHAAFMPIRETGNTVSPPGGTANFYGVVEGIGQGDKVVIGNVGAADATYRIWRYVPDSLIVPARFPPWLGDTSGSWSLKATQVVPAGWTQALNPRVYNRDGAAFDQSNTMVLAKVELTGGGPIQVLHGIRVYSLWGGGTVVHPTSGGQTGLHYWINHYPDENKNCTWHTYYVDVFCPKNGMAIRMTSEDGYSASYTTTGPDQCVSFMGLSPPATKRNYNIDVLPNPAQGNAVCQFIACTGSEKGYTAPFLQQGVHYTIIAPPIVFSGQSFWITIIVQDVGGTTKTDYTGTTSFTSTDASTKIEGQPMDGYNYLWPLANAGVHIFVNVTMTKLGLQSIVASDTMDGTISGVTAVNVIAADVKLDKTPRLMIAASGDTVQFKICWSNYSSASAFTFVITDAVPRGTSYVPEVFSALDCGNTNGLTLTVAYATASSAAPPAAFTTITSGSPAAGTTWLRWTAPYTGVRTTGCACFRVVVN